MPSFRIACCTDLVRPAALSRALSLRHMVSHVKGYGAAAEPNRDNRVSRAFVAAAAAGFSFLVVALVAATGSSNNSSSPTFALQQLAARQLQLTSLEQTEVRVRCF